MSNLDERYYKEEETKYYSLLENGEVIVGAVDKKIAEKWLERKLEEGANDVAIIPVPEEITSEESVEDDAENKDVEEVNKDFEEVIEEIIEDIEDLEERSNNGTD